MASITGSGSQLAFFGHGNGIGAVNVDLTTTGTGTQPQPLPGKLNIEVFTSTIGPVAPGYDASAFVLGARLLGNNLVSNTGQTNVTEELLTGSFKLVDETGHEAIQIVGSASGGDSMSVVGSAGDTITGSSVAGTQQLIDASGKNHLASPGPETVLGGNGPTTVLAGVGDSIVGGSGSMLVVGGFNDTVVGGSGATTIEGGLGDSIVAGTGGIISIYGGNGHDHVANAGGTTVIDGGHGHSTVTGFDNLTDDIHSPTSVSPEGKFLGTSQSSAAGTTMNFVDGSTMFLAGVSDPTKIHFTK